MFKSGQVLDLDGVGYQVIESAKLEGEATPRFVLSPLHSMRLPPNGINFDQLERDLVRQALELAGGNQTQAAKLLGMKRDQVRYRVEKFGLKSSGRGGPRNHMGNSDRIYVQEEAPGTWRLTAGSVSRVLHHSPTAIEAHRESFKIIIEPPADVVESSPSTAVNG